MAESDEVLEVRRRARRRLIGAVALVLFLVIVPPWLMDLEPRPVTPNLSVEMPGKDQPKLEPPAAPDPAKSVPPEPAKAADPVRQEVPVVARPAPSEGAKAAPAKAEPVAKVPPVEPSKAQVAKDAKDAKDPRDAKAAAVKPPADDGKRAAAILKDETFYVPLGAFSKADNAKQVQAKAGGVGVKVFVEQVDVNGETQTRVRAGPYPTREAAEAARERLKGAGLDPGGVRTR